MAQRVESLSLRNCQNGKQEPLRPGVLHVWHEGQRPVVAVLYCPCGCGDLLSLPLDSRRQPHWELAFDNGKPSLKPEVERLDGCRSRFQIDNGEVKFR